MVSGKRGQVQDRIVLLRTVADIGERANWYKVGRLALGLISSPARFTEDLRWLIEHGFLVEQVGEGDQLPQLSVTAAGHAALHKWRADEAT